MYTTSHVLTLDENAQVGIRASIVGLESYLSEVQKQVAEMREQVGNLKSEIKAIYDAPELKKHLYVLHSILVHDGQAGSGHYYAFIFEWDSKVWRKYNDINVTIVD